MTYSKQNNDPAPQTENEGTVIRPDHVPEKFWDPDAGTIRVDALLKSYRELEQFLSKRQTEIEPEPELNRIDLLKKLGRPDSADDYCIQCDHGYFGIDPALNARLHDLGFTQDQVQAVYDLAAEKLVPMVVDLVADMRAEQELNRLHTHFGGPEGWRTISRQMLAFGRKHMRPDVLQALSSSYEGIVTLHRLMMADHQGGVPTGVGDMADDGGIDRLHAMMRDPKYWRDRDPSVMQKVSDGFARVYG